MKLGGAGLLKTFPDQVDVERLGLGMVFAGHPLGKRHVPPKLVVDLGGHACPAIVQDLKARIVIDFQEFVERQRLGILPRPSGVGRVGAGELGLDQDQVTAWKMEHDVGLRVGPLHRQVRLESLPGRNQEFHRVEGVFGEADSPEIEERFDRAGVAGDGPCKPAQATGFLEGPENVPRYGIFGTLQPKTVGLVLEGMMNDDAVASRLGEAMMLPRTSA